VVREADEPLKGLKNGHQYQQREKTWHLFCSKHLQTEMQVKGGKSKRGLVGDPTRDKGKIAGKVGRRLQKKRVKKKKKKKKKKNK